MGTFKWRSLLGTNRWAGVGQAAHDAMRMMPSSQGCPACVCLLSLNSRSRRWQAPVGKLPRDAALAPWAEPRWGGHGAWAGSTSPATAEERDGGSCGCTSLPAGVSQERSQPGRQRQGAPAFPARLSGPAPLLYQGPAGTEESARPHLQEAAALQSLESHWSIPSDSVLVTH